MKKNRLGMVVTILIVITVLAAMVHLFTREEIDKDSIRLKTSEDEYFIHIEELSCETIKGIRVNGKGEEVYVEGKGIQLKNLLKRYKVESFEKVRIGADDSYEAQVKAEEIEKDNKVCLFYEDGGRMRLVVFGDENSKRSVSNVVSIIVE